MSGGFRVIGVRGVPGEHGIPPGQHGDARSGRRQP
jgi:hypothetical protein